MKFNNFQANNCFEHNILSFLVTSANERVKKKTTAYFSQCDL